MLWLLLACPSPTDSADTVEEDVCTAEFNKVFPEDASTGVYIRTPLQFYLTQPDPSAQIATDIPGHMETSEDGRVLSWIPDDPLQPESSNSLTLNGCFGSASTHFQTSRAGQPLESDLQGRTWLLQFKQGRADTPSTELLAPYLLGYVRMEVLRQTSTALTLRSTYSRDASFAEECEVAQQFAVFNEAPNFTTIPSNLAFPHLYHAQLSGTFTPDAKRIEGIHITGQWDVRDLEADGLNTQGETPEHLCGILAAVHLPCTPCDDGEPLCMELSASLIPADEWVGSPGEDKSCSGCNSSAIPVGGWLFAGMLAAFGRRRQSDCS